MTWVAVGLVGSAVVGGVASNMAANKQAGGGKDAMNFQKATENKNRMLLDPYAQGGMYGMSAMREGLGVNGGHYDPNSPLMKPFSLQDFNASPAYQFNLAEGTKAIDKAANARGNLYAPQTLQDISKFSQGTASNEFNNAYNMYNQNQGNQFNRLATLSGQGIGAAGALAGVSTQMSNQIGNTMEGIGNAQASGIMGANNAIQGGIGQAYNQYLMNQIMKQNNGSLYNQQPTQSGFGAP